MLDKSKPLPGEDILILSWDMTGIESVVSLKKIYDDTDAEEKQQMIDILKSDKNPRKIITASNRASSILNALTMRARFNTQRHYEVYVIRVNESITEDDMRQMFDDNPQEMADLVREKGISVWSDRVPDNQTIKIR